MESSNPRICVECIGDHFLRDAIELVGQRAVCNYCGNEQPTFELEEIADHVEQAFEKHYERTPENPDGYEYALQKEGLREWDRRGEKVVVLIQDEVGVTEDIAKDIRDLLAGRHPHPEAFEMGQEQPFSADAQYEPKLPDGHIYHQAWSKFEDELRTKSRYFSSSTKKTLDAIFKEVAALKTHSGVSVVTDAGPGTPIKTLFRARVFQSESKVLEALKYPDKELGPPPPGLASAGRMNAKGIAVFYGAAELDTAIAEVRPPVGSSVVTGEFKILRPLRLLNLEALSGVYAKGSIFDPAYAKERERAAFLGNLTHKMNRPVQPHDEENSYLTTQVIAEYLAMEAGLDGIIYPSVQKNGASRNVVLFHDASRVETLAIPPRTEISADLYESDDEGFHLAPTVIERVDDSAADDRPKEVDPFTHFAMAPPEKNDGRAPTLEVLAESVQFHSVKAVEITCESAKVTRFRWEKSKERNVF